MFSTAAIAAFADRYSDHVVFASSTATGATLAGVWHVIPLEIAALLTAVLFVAARICVERWIHSRHEKRARKAHKRNAAHPHKRRAPA
jgi:hypothetical protein